MQRVGSTFNAYPDARHVGIGITFKLIDPAAAAGAAASSNGAEAVSDLSRLTVEGNRASGKWAALEKNLWALDGTWCVLADQADGYWSTALSGADGLFAVNPTLTMDLSAPASSIGFTLHFDEQAQCWPSEVKIVTSGDATAKKTFQNHGPKLAADMPTENYSRVIFEFVRTSVPFRRIKLYEVVFGIIQNFDPSSIVSATFKAGCSAACESVPTRELAFTFDNSDKKYNLINPAGIYAYLQDGQEILATISIDGVAVDMGTHYFRKAEAKDGALTAEITANDRFYWLDAENYDGGATGTWTLSEALRAVLGADAALDVSVEVGARIVGKCIPLETKKREAVRMLAQAARCCCWIDRAGAYVFRELSASAPVDTLDADNMESMDGVSVSDKVDCVKLSVRDEFAKTDEVVHAAGEGKKTLSIRNPCAHEGQAVADWLLSVKQRRLEYACVNRGNPAVEVGDTMTIYNAYDEAGDAAVYDYTLEFDGGLTETTKALGEAWS